MIKHYAMNTVSHYVLELGMCIYSNEDTDVPICCATKIVKYVSSLAALALHFTFQSSTK